MKRVVTAFLVAPIAPFLVYLVASVTPWGMVLLFAAIFGLPVVYLAAFIGGVPLYLVIKKRPHLHRWYICAFFAGLLGVLAMCLFTMFATNGAIPSWQELCLMGVWGMAHGAASGIVFWRITKPTLKHSNAEVASHA